MEVLGRQPCKMEQELGWEGFHPSSAHQLFDGMPSQPGLSREDQRISEPVPINSTMNKEEKWLDEALDQILEKFEQMEAKRRQEDKLNQIFQKLEEIEACKSKASEETIAAIRATTAILKAASSPTPMAPPPPVPTNCLMECHNNNITLVAVNSSHIGEVLTPMVAFELGDVEDKDPVPYIVNKDSRDKDDSLLNLDTSNVIPVIAASSTSLLVHAETDSMMFAKCLKLGLNVNTSTVQTGVVFPLFLDELDIITAPGESMLVMVQRLGSVFFLKMLAHDGCSMKCARDDKLLMEPSNKNPWPPPWLGGVVRVCELRHAPWTELNSCWATGHLMPPWPPPIRPWPPSQQASFRFVPFQARNSECGNSVTALSTIAWNKWKKIRSTACDSCFEQEMKDGQNTEESECELTVKVYQYSPGDGSAIEKLFIDGLCSKKNSELCASAKYANYWLVRCLEDTEDKCPIHRMLLVVVVTWKVDAYAILRGAAIKIEQHLPCDIFHTRQASTEQVIKSYVSNSKEIQELQMPWDPGGEKLSQFMLSACGQAEIQEKGIVRDSSGPYDGLILTQALAQASPNGEATKQRQQQCSRRHRTDQTSAASATAAAAAAAAAAWFG
uniref:Uncharacterized protein n=1 Tax=Oryza barthii TaxID=65489 RepID=A0A0D3FT78_9ORYZ